MDFDAERRRMVGQLKATGVIISKSVERAMLAVRRELFVPPRYRDSAYAIEALPIPPFTGEQTISAPDTYPMFYEPLVMRKGDRVLEVGAGSGYGAALAAEMVGAKNVVTIETNKETFEFARRNLEAAGYSDITLIHGDGSKGYAPRAPYDKIIVTASHPRVPEPLIIQLKKSGRLIFPQGPKWPSQDLMLIEKDEKGALHETLVGGVVYVPLKGEHGYKE